MQKNPSDDTLRERVIRLGLTIDPEPAPPPEVQDLLGTGGRAFDDAKKDLAAGNTAEAKTDLGAAADAFAKASLLAPWFADYYLDLGKADEAGKDYPNAVKNYGFYLEAAPHAQDVDEVRQGIAGMKYELRKQTDAAAAAAAAAAQEQEAAIALQQSFTGRWCLDDSFWSGGTPGTCDGRGSFIEIDGPDGSASISEALFIPVGTGHCNGPVPPGCETQSTGSSHLSAFRIQGSHLTSRVTTSETTRLFGIPGFNSESQTYSDRYEISLSISADGRQLSGTYTSYWSGGGSTTHHIAFLKSN